MADNFERALAETLKTDPVLKEVPAFSKKEKIKSLLAKQQEEIGHLSTSKSGGKAELNALAPLLSATHKRFKEQIALLAKLKSEGESLGLQLAKVEQEKTMVSGLEEGLTAKYKALVETLKAEENKLSDDLKAYMDTRQAEIDSEQKKFNELREQKLDQEHRAKFLAEKKEKVFSQVDKFLEARDNLLKEKTREIGELEEKLTSSLQMLLSTAEVNESTVQSATEFVEKHKAAFEATSDRWTALSRPPDPASVLIESISSQIGKVQTLKSNSEKETLSLREKLRENALKVTGFVKENADLLAALKAEEAKTAMFEKLEAELQAKANASS